MNLYVDMGANWANTIRLGPELFPGRSGWLTVAFEASPLIQPYVEKYVAYLNGERLKAPAACLPRSGSTQHLRRYASAIGCTHVADEAMRNCVWTAMAAHLSTLRANPKLNSSKLINKRLQEASEFARRPCLAGCRSHFISVPAAVGAHAGWIKMWGSPRQLLRGGAKPVAQAPNEKSGLFTVRVVDVADWLTRAAPSAKFVFLKMDVEGAEHELLKRMEAVGVHRHVNAIALECHDFAGGCSSTMRRISNWNATIIKETAYNGMDSISAADTRIPARCLLGKPLKQSRGSVTRDMCKPAHIVPKTFSTCAVVGSAPSLAHLYQGDAIDLHSAVYRTNSHVNVDTVGKKTTFRVAANTFQLGTHRTAPEDGVMHLLPPASKALHPGNLVTDKDIVRCVPNKTMDALYAEVGVTFGDKMLSTGALALGVALYSCKSVTIYGFGGLQSYDHVLRDTNHDWFKELVWVRGLIKNKRVKDGTDRGVHMRKCEVSHLVRDALKILKRRVFGSVEREVAMPVHHLLEEAIERSSEACPSVVNAISRWMSGSLLNTFAVDSALLKYYKSKL